MAKYNLFHVIDASSCETVEADSPEEALEMAENNQPRECANCTEFELADCIKTIVSDEHGNEVFETKTAIEEQLEREQSAHQKTRRRILALLFHKRADWSMSRSYFLRKESPGFADLAVKEARICLQLANAIEAQTPITYFARLADTHDSNGELKAKLREES